MQDSRFEDGPAYIVPRHAHDDVTVTDGHPSCRAILVPVLNAPLPFSDCAVCLVSRI